MARCMRSAALLLALAGCCLCSPSLHSQLTVNKQSWADHAPEHARRQLSEKSSHQKYNVPSGPVGSIQSLLPPVPETSSMVNDTTQSPYSSVGLLAIATVSDYDECSATLIAPNAVLTAAHCIYDVSSGSAAYEVTFVPGLNPASSQPYPYGSARARAIRFPDSIPSVCSASGASESCLQGLDYAVVFLDTNYTQPTMLVGLNSTAFGAVNAHSAGYPGNQCNGFFFNCNMWKTTCKDVLFNDIASLVVEGCVSHPGQSGSPIWIELPGVGNVITGVLINTEATSGSDTAQRWTGWTDITSGIQNEIQSWLREGITLDSTSG